MKTRRKNCGESILGMKMEYLGTNLVPVIVSLFGICTSVVIETASEWICTEEIKAE